MIVADTDVLIDALCGREPALQRIDFEIASGQLATTSISLFELLSGGRTEAQREKIERLLAAVTVLSLDPDAARIAADIRRDLDRRGQPIGMADCLIAGLCVARSQSLLTRNVKHFARVRRLTLASLAPPRVGLEGAATNGGGRRLWSRDEFARLLQRVGDCHVCLAEALGRTPGAVECVRGFAHAFHTGGKLSGVSKMMVDHLRRMDAPEETCWICHHSARCATCGAPL